jgi:hypothetical protein
MSAIGWIDFSSEHRDKVKTVIDLLAASNVLDELGIGVALSSFSDRMFPGISTIQTRAKYFVLTALILQNFQERERRKRNPRGFGRYMEKEEKRCRIELVKTHGEGRQNLGIIGGKFGLSNDRDVVRKPSSIYWSGLKTFGIVFPRTLSLAEFGRSISDDRRQISALVEDRGDEKGDDLDAEDSGGRIRIKVPEIGDDYWEKLSIALTRPEAEFLRGQIIAYQPDSLIGQILSRDNASKQVVRLTASARFGDFAELPFIAELKNEELRRTVQHARDFWRIMEGAHIRYNCLLQAKGFGTSELREEFEGMWEDWREAIADFPAKWDSHFLWALVSRHGSRVKDHTRKFIDGWIELSRLGAPDEKLCDHLVTRQEQLNKGSRARLRPGNSEAINEWVGLRGAGYRAAQVIQIVRDIRDGEKSE